MSISTYKVTKKSAHIQVFSLDMCRLNYGLSLYRDFFSALGRRRRLLKAQCSGGRAARSKGGGEHQHSPAHQRHAYIEDYEHVRLNEDGHMAQIIHLRVKRQGVSVELQQGQADAHDIAYDDA